MNQLYTSVERKKDPGGHSGDSLITAKLNGEEYEVMKQRLDHLMREKRPFLLRGYRLKHLSDDLGLPNHQVSTYINQKLRMHFSDYMNKFRIKHCLELLNTNLKSRPDLNQLAQQCGFNNRSSFTSAFKKFTGQPPFEYIKRQLFIQLMVSLQTLNGKEIQK